MIFNLSIMDGNITAIGSVSGSGIGSGYGREGNSTVLNLSIMGGNITATNSGSGAGIGSGGVIDGGHSVVETLSIMGGRITANGVLVGIGSGYEGGEVRMLTFSGEVVLMCNANSSQFSINASSIVLRNTSLTIATHRNRVFGTSPSSSGSTRVCILYGNVGSERSEPFLDMDGVFLQIGNVSLPYSGPWTFFISGKYAQDCTECETLRVSGIAMSGITVSLPSEGNYSIRASTNNASGFLETADGQSLFSVETQYSFIPVALFIPTYTPTGTFTVSFQIGLRRRRFMILRFSWMMFTPLSF
jgi:hypothetical protein